MAASADNEAQGDGGRPLPVPVRASDATRGEILDAPPGGALERLAAGPLAGPAIAAAGGFLAGFTTFIAARVAHGRRGRRVSRRRRRAVERQIESSRSFLVDVHVLRR